MTTLTASVRTLLSFYHQHPELAHAVFSSGLNHPPVPWDDIFRYTLGRKPATGCDGEGRKHIRDDGWGTLYLKLRMLTAHRVVVRMMQRLASEDVSSSYRERCTRRVSLALLYRFFTRREQCFDRLWRNLQQADQSLVYSSELWNEIYRFRFGVSPEIDSTAEGRWRQLFEVERMLSVYGQFLDHISFG